MNIPCIICKTICDEGEICCSRKCAIQLTKNMKIGKDLT